MYFLEKVKTALQKLENHKVLLKDPMKDHGRSWTLLGSALVSLDLESLDMIFDVGASIASAT